MFFQQSEQKFYFCFYEGGGTMKTWINMLGVGLLLTLTLSLFAETPMARRFD